MLLKALLTVLFTALKKEPKDFVSIGELVIFATFIVSTPSMFRKLVSFIGPLLGVKLFVTVCAPRGSIGLGTILGVPESLGVNTSDRSFWR